MTATVRAYSNDCEVSLSITVSLENRGGCVQAPVREKWRGNKEMIYAGVHVGQHSSNLPTPTPCVSCFFLSTFSPGLFLTLRLDATLQLNKVHGVD